MIEPKFIYSCDHNLIEYGKKHKTIKVLRSPYADNDVFTVGGVFLSIDRVYYPGKMPTQVFSCKNSSFGCLYEKDIDFTVSCNNSGNLVEIDWGVNHPPNNEYFYVDVTYDATVDTEITYDKRTFTHSQNIDVIPNVPQNIQVIVINSKSKTYREGIDYIANAGFGDYANEYSYNLYIEWIGNSNPNKEQCTMTYFVAYDTNENDMSKGAIVDNEDENIPLLMQRQRDSSVCPRCNGTGWYVGLFEKNCHRAKNANRMLQEFVKLLYTTSSDDGKYFLTLAGTTTISSEENIRALISNIVANSLERYNKMLVEAKKSGRIIQPAEQIYQAGVSDISVYEDNTGVEAKITIVTDNGQVANIVIDS